MLSMEKSPRPRGPVPSRIFSIVPPSARNSAIISCQGQLPFEDMEAARTEKWIPVPPVDQIVVRAEVASIFMVCREKPLANDLECSIRGD